MLNGLNSTLDTRKNRRKYEDTAMETIKTWAFLYGRFSSPHNISVLSNHTRFWDTALDSAYYKTFLSLWSPVGKCWATLKHREKMSKIIRFPKDDGKQKNIKINSPKYSKCDEYCNLQV